MDIQYILLGIGIHSFKYQVSGVRWFVLSIETI